MNGAAVVFVCAFATWVILKAIRDVHHIRRHRVPPVWEQDQRARQLAREVDESAPITWRR